LRAFFERFVEMFLFSPQKHNIYSKLSVSRCPTPCWWCTHFRDNSIHIVFRRQKNSKRDVLVPDIVI
jgi:hypothetical protein